MTRLNLLDLIDVQRAERFRAFVVHAEAMAGKTATARRLEVRVPDAVYVDLLDVFPNNPEWCARIDRFGLDDLSEYLLNLETPGQVIIVDHLDFLLNTWSRSKKRGFVQWVDEGLDGFTTTQKIFIFFIQSDPAITEYPLRRPNRLGHTRVFRLDDFYAL
ncbi:MAG: hypothetical protein MAG451_02819 [Anaerolineales bacterium]|nr:hypothetical protein [Anaerolineales bacterium]